MKKSQTFHVLVVIFSKQLVVSHRVFMKKNSIIYIKFKDYYYYFAIVIITKTTPWMTDDWYFTQISSYQFSGLHFSFKKQKISSHGGVFGTH